MKSKPFFSICVTTYKRHDFLVQCLNSILTQSFNDYEVIIANDCPGDNLTMQSLGVEDDPRFRIINNSENLGEYKNMNMLLNEATGKYFSWIADDDLYTHDLLSKIAECIDHNQEPECVFSSFKHIHGDSDFFVEKKFQTDCQPFDGDVFMRDALSGKVKTMASMGFYRLDFMQRIGGMPDPGNVKEFPGLYGEYVLFFFIGLIGKVYFINESLILFRIHSGQELASKFNISMIVEGSRNYIRYAVDFFEREHLLKYFKPNMTSIMKLCLVYTASALYRNEKKSLLQTLCFVAKQAYYKEFTKNKYFKKIRSAYFSALFKAYCQLFINQIKKT